MKYLKSILCVAAVGAMVTSCSNIEEPISDGEYREVTISANADCNTVRSRTAGDAGTDNTNPTRFAISVWEDADCTVAANVCSDKSNFVTSTNGTFSLPYLHIAKDYYCLFWADNGEDYTLGTTLKDVALADNKTVSEAFQGKLTLAKGRETAYSVTLTHAVGSLTLWETAKIPAGYTMSLSYSTPSAFNVATGTPTGADKSFSHNWTSEAVDGTTTSAVLKDGIYILAPTAEKKLIALTYNCNDENAVTIPNVPFRANYKTSVYGHFTQLESVSFNLTHSTDWNTDELKPSSDNQL